MRRVFAAVVNPSWFYVSKQCTKKSEQSISNLSWEFVGMVVQEQGHLVLVEHKGIHSRSSVRLGGAAGKEGPITSILWRETVRKARALKADEK